MRQQELNLLKQDCEKCTKCELYKSRTNIVFSDGNPDTAKAVLIGEAPGENEDLSGKPFVGRAGKLLNEFLKKAGIDREKDLYIINTLKCRPPKNRIPKDSEKKACEEYLLKQIEIVNPKILIFCGATALKSFYKEKTPISKIRGQWLEIEKPYPSEAYPSKPCPSQRCPSKPNPSKPCLRIRAIAIFHPSYLLRNYSFEENSPRDLMLKDLIKIKNYLDLK